MCVSQNSRTKLKTPVILESVDENLKCDEPNESYGTGG